MYFTQEDYRKIENWLHRNLVKDSEFQEALPFTGKEIVTIVQGGHNRKVNIQEFINQLNKHGVRDFLNITNTYGANNITLKEAISLIPAKARKEGQVITFLNTDGNWEIYQFIGKLNQWNNPTLWSNPFDWEKLIIDSILPDEEDLTKSLPDANGNAYLSLKDRKYEPDKYSGLGRKILRKRIIEIEDPVNGVQEKNLLLQEDFIEGNTIYEIRYDFDLNNREILIPENSILDYQGGSISNGKIIYNDTTIIGKETLKEVIVEGPMHYLYPTGDNEDIISIKGKLSLKDRDTKDGMGYIILRKDKSFEEQLTQDNTIYEVRYDFDLDSNTAVMPKNSKFIFNGGTLKYNGVSIKDNIVYAKSIGMIPEISSDIVAMHNYNKIIEAQNLGFKLIIDDSYYVLCDSESVLFHLDIEGISTYIAKLIFKNSEGFKIDNSISYISFKNISVDTLAMKGDVYGNDMIYVIPSPKNLVSVLFENIYIEGMRLIHIESVDTSMDDWSFQNITFRNIESRNFGMLARLNDIPFKRFLCEDCVFIDFYHCIFNLGTTNEYTNSSSHYNESVVFRNNKAEGTKVFSHLVTYQCLAVVEAIEVHYYNNSIKNIVNTNAESIIYDSYLTCDVLYYYNNTVENIASLSSYRDIFKNKMGGFSQLIKRYIYNNSYTLSKSFFEKNNLLETNDEGYIYNWGNTLGNAQDIMEHVYFANNRVVCEFGILSFGNFIQGKNVVFRDNYIKGDIRDTFGSTAIWVLRDSNIVVDNNTIINNTAERTTWGYLFRPAYSAELGISIPEKVIFQNNTLENVNCIQESPDIKLSASDFKSYFSKFISNNNYFLISVIGDIAYATYIGDNSIIHSKVEPVISIMMGSNIQIKGTVVIEIFSRFLRSSELTNYSIISEYDRNLYYDGLNTDNVTIYSSYNSYVNVTKNTNVYIEYGPYKTTSLNILANNRIIMQNFYISEISFNTTLNKSYYIRPMIGISSFRNSMYPYYRLDNKKNFPIFLDTEKNKLLWHKDSGWVDANGLPENTQTSGPTASRPTNGIPIGFQYFDTDLGSPIWWNGSVWIDSAGAVAQ